MGIRTDCAPVTKVENVGQTTNYHQDFDVNVRLTVIDGALGLVSCPMLEERKCQGKYPCVVNDVDLFTTVVEPS